MCIKNLQVDDYREVMCFSLIHYHFVTYQIMSIAQRTVGARTTHDYASRQINVLRPRQDGRHFANDIFKCILLNGNIWILLKISLTLVPKVRINDILALVQITAWRRVKNRIIWLLKRLHMVNWFVHHGKMIGRVVLRTQVHSDGQRRLWSHSFDEHDES